MRGTSTIRRVGAAAGAIASNLAVAGGLVQHHENYRRFILVTPPRSGSTMLTWTLSQHPALVSYGEIFHESFIGWGKEPAPSLMSESRLDRLRRDDPLKFLSTHIWRGRAQSVKAVGFKVLYNQILSSDNRTLADLFCLDRRIRVIHLAENRNFGRISRS